jgi:WD40 repeat protein
MKNLFSAGALAVVSFAHFATAQSILLEIPKVHSGFRAFAFSPDGKSVAGGTGAGKMTSGGGKEEIFGGDVLIWDAASGRIQRTLKGHDASVSWVAYSSDGRTLASASAENGTLKLWDAQSGAVRHTLKLPGKIGTNRNGTELLCALSRDGRSIAAVAKQSSGPVVQNDVRSADTLMVWDAGSGKLRWQLEGAQFYALTFSPDSSTLAGVRINHKTEGASAQKANVTSTDQLFVGWETTTGKERWSVPTGGKIALSLQFTPEGRLAAFDDRRLYFVEPAGGASGIKEVKISGTGSIRDGRLSADGKRFAASRFMGDGIEWGDTATGKVTAFQPFTPDRFQNVEFSSDLEMAIGVLKFTPQILKLTPGPVAATDAKPK